MKIEKFSILNLNNNSDISVAIDDNLLVIVAENGAGKTTVLRMLYLFLSKQWSKLNEYQFGSVEAEIDGKKFSFVKSEFTNISIPSKVIADAVADYPLYRKFIEDNLANYDVAELLNNSLITESLESKYDVPPGLINSILKRLSKFEFDDRKYDWDVDVLYLPTYRRIERNFESLYGDISNLYAQQIKHAFPFIKQTIDAEKFETKSNVSETEDELSRMFDIVWRDRHQERWLGSGSSSHLELIEFGMEDVKFRISRLMSSFDQFEDVVGNYLSICNKYLVDGKTLALSKSKRFLEVCVPEKDVNLDIDTLSSGEKQIISLFSYLLINPSKRFVIIDEPELSLSIKWQEMLLDDLLNFKVNGLIVATHSPFIVTPFFKDYTRGLNEFR